MKKTVELPLTAPIYSTFHHQGSGCSVIVSNPSIKSWYLNQVMMLTCTRKFLSGYTSPQIGIVASPWNDNPYIEKKWFSLHHLKGCTNLVVRNLIDDGYYVCFSDVDDYYIEGKTWYKQRHFAHDGMICGYNQTDKTFCIYAYDSNWVYQKFWTPQKSFIAGIKSMFKKGVYGKICGIKPLPNYVWFSVDIACKNIKEYLDSDLTKYPEDEEGSVYGIAVHDYIIKYLGKLLDNSIPYERIDKRIFRLIWEHKKVMLERIQRIEKVLGLTNDISKQYEPLVAEADTIRMLYASHHIRRRDAVLPIIQKKLLNLKENEQKLLSKLLIKKEEVSPQ